MKTLVLFYSYTGHTKKLAQAYADKESADIAEIGDQNRPGMLKAFLGGCFAALRGKPWPIKPLSVEWPAYDRINLFFPIWAGNPPPAVIEALAMLPEGKTISVTAVSGSGQSACQAKVEAWAKEKGCAVDRFEDVKG